LGKKKGGGQIIAEKYQCL